MKPYRLKPHEKRTIVGNWDRRVWIGRSTMFLVPPFVVWCLMKMFKGDE